MTYLLIGLLAGLAIATAVSYFNEQGKIHFLVMMVLLQNAERGDGNFIQIDFGKDQEGLQKVLQKLVRVGHVKVQEVDGNREYKLTPSGFKLARELSERVRKN